MVVTAKTSNKLIRIREFHINYVGHAQWDERSRCNSVATRTQVKQFFLINVKDQPYLAAAHCRRAI
jgi:hypothetical protein